MSTTVEIDEDGTWEVTQHPSGAQSRILVDPSPAYLDRHETERAASTRESMLQLLQERRRQAEEGGVEFNGYRIGTDRESQAMLTGALVMMQADPSRVIQWKTTDGQFFPADFADLQAMAQAIFEHVEACFAREAALRAAIEAAEDPSVIDIESGWPDGTA